MDYNFFYKIHDNSQAIYEIFLCLIIYLISIKSQEVKVFHEQFASLL